MRSRSALRSIHSRHSPGASLARRVEKVLDFPRVEVTSEENARRVMIEARLIDVRRHSRIGTIAKMKDTLGKSLRFHASAR